MQSSFNASAQQKVLEVIRTAEYNDMSAISLWHSEVLKQFMFYILSGVLKFEIACIKFQPIQMVKD